MQKITPTINLYSTKATSEKRFPEDIQTCKIQNFTRKQDWHDMYIIIQ